jgi:hypothetical protein
VREQKWGKSHVPAAKEVCNYTESFQGTAAVANKKAL